MMLCLYRKVGEAVKIGSSRLVLLGKNHKNVTISLDGVEHVVPMHDEVEFKTFTLYVYQNEHGIRLGFTAPRSVLILREELV